MIDSELLGLGAVRVVHPARHGDHRGYFSEVFNKRGYAEIGIPDDFIQDNVSLSADPGTLRGLHFQIPPFAQAKLVRVARGRVFDVAVDIRKGSPTFSRWVGRELSADNWEQLYVPAGFAHGFVTLEPDTEFVYKVSADYAPAHERSIRFDDPDINIIWPQIGAQFKLSKKDQEAPYLREVDTEFVFEADDK